MQVPYRLLATAVMSGVLALSSCAYEKKHNHPLYGWVAQYDGDPSDRVISIVLPAKAPSIQQRFRPFSAADESGNSPGIHEGIDISGRVADPVLAAAAGKVTESRRSWTWGNEIRIDHGRDESGRYVQTLYVHLDERLVAVNERVRRGQQIGTLGITGMAAGDPPHLHFVVYSGPTVGFSRHWSPVSPHLYWADGVGKVTCYEEGRGVPATPLRLTYPAPCLHR